MTTEITWHPYPETKPTEVEEWYFGKLDCGNADPIVFVLYYDMDNRFYDEAGNSYDESGVLAWAERPKPYEEE